MNPELKQIWEDLKRSPAILITVIIAIIVIIWYVYNQNAGGTGSASAGQPTYEVESISVTPPPPSTSGDGSTSPTGTGGGNPLFPPKPTPAGGHAQGTTFTGPTGVKHYVTTGNETLAQIASKLGLPSYNAIYGVPENKSNGWVPKGLTATQASNYKPAANTPIVY